MERTPDAGSTQRVNYSHAMPTDGGLSWNMSLAHQSQARSYQQGTLGWRNNNVELQGGGYGERGKMTWWGETIGAVVLMDGQLFAANRINDAFAVISTGGNAGVPVNYENQPVGVTDKNGYLLVSGVSAYYPASYSINTLNLPADTQLKNTERKVALRRQSGYLIEFPMVQERVASVILHDEQGLAIPVGSQVERRGKAPAVVGYDGIAWLENLENINRSLSACRKGESVKPSSLLAPTPNINCRPTGRLPARGIHNASATFPVSAALCGPGLVGLYSQHR